MRRAFRKGRTELITLFGVLSLLLLMISTPALAQNNTHCFICEDCESNFTSSHLTQCPKKGSKCVKIVYSDEKVDRTCADASKCGNAGFTFPTQRPKPSPSPPADLRRKRALLGENKPQVQKGEISAIYCCDSDECNKSTAFSPEIPLLLLCFVLPIL